MRRLKKLACGSLAAVMITIGGLHLVRPEPFIQIMPDYLPAHRLLVYLSGGAEIAGGLGLLIPRWRRAAAWGLIALYIAVFPANVNMAVKNMPLGGQHYPLLLWLRLPAQGLLVAWAWWLSRSGERV